MSKQSIHVNDAKILSREKIIDNLKSGSILDKDGRIPEHRSFVSLSGQCSRRGGKLFRGCEPAFYKLNGLFNYSQYCGIDSEIEWIKKNKTACPHATWINDSFSEAVVRLKNVVNPAVINFDSESYLTQESANQWLSALRWSLKVKEEVLVVANFIFNYRQGDQKAEVTDKVLSHVGILNEFEDATYDKYETKEKNTKMWTITLKKLAY